jgi:MscS family membrane protein
MRPPSRSRRARRCSSARGPPPPTPCRHISPRPEGNLDDGLPPDVEEVGRIPKPNGLQEPVRLTHLDAGESSRWIFSASTVEKIDGWFATLPDRWVLEYLPPQLLRPGPADLLWWQWLAMPLVLLLAWVLGALLGRITRIVLGHLVRRTVITWDDLLLERLAGPLTVAWTLVVLRALVKGLGLYKPAEEFIGVGVQVGLTFVFFWALLRSIDVLRDALAQSEWARGRSGMNALLPLAGRVLKAVVLGMGVVGVLSLMGFPVASLIAGLGIGGIALALAAQKTGENLFGAFSIGVDKPFSEGDLVRVDDVEGVVEEIGLRSTRLRTPDRTLVTLPNSRVAEAKLESLAARDRLRFAATIGLVYGTTAAQMRAILRGIEQLLLAERDLWPDTMVVSFKSLGESSLDVEIMCWFRTTNLDEYRKIRERVLLGIMDVVEREGSGFAYPTRTVHVVGEKSALPMP